MLESHTASVLNLHSPPRRTSTDVALSLLNIVSIEVEIDYRKLTPPPPILCLGDFIHRLVEYKSHPNAVQGFFASCKVFITRFVTKKNRMMASLFQNIPGNVPYGQACNWRSRRCVNSANANSIMRIKEFNRGSQ